MEAFRIENLTFTYPNREASALAGVNLVIERGDFVVLAGPSGCGKTTLLRHLKPLAAPHGEKSGVISFEGTHIAAMSDRDAAARIGFVTQSPDNQIVTDKVWHELAFGLESLGLATPEIRLRVAEMASFFGIQTWFHKSVTELSGGQKQLLALASVMAMQPSALILDEPTSQLDPIAAGEFLATLGRINREFGVTVILTEHRLEEVFPLSSRVVVMDGGRIIADGEPRKVGLELRGRSHGMFLAMPTPMRIWAASKSEDDICPITVRDGADWLADQSVDGGKLPKDVPVSGKETAVSLNDIWFKYEKNQPDVLKGLTFEARYGEITAILGGNGTGKTTALSVMSGLRSPYRGKISADAKVYMMSQSPQSSFVAKTVREDLLEILSDREITRDEKSRRIADIAKLCRLESLLDSHPYDLSGGEQQRAALAKLLLLQPQILLLDEPTKGLDAEFKQEFAAMLRGLAEDGTAVVVVSHDVEFAAEYADRCVLFFDGGIVAENTPRAFFGGNSFYTTSANRMARGILPGAVTAGDVVLALGGKLPQEQESVKIDIKPIAPKPEKPADPPQDTGKARSPSNRAAAASALILLTIPLTIFAGMYIFDDRRYEVVSLLIIFQTMLPFVLAFESRKPQAGELVIIAVLCAIAIAGRMAFFALPQFKPVTALVTISGIAFGPQAGFLVGAITALVSNMFFGQGPWTPWQMFAFGLIGFLAGILFRKGGLSRAPASIAAFGAFAAFVVYGGIMNPASVLMFQPSPAPAMFIVAFAYGAPFDLVHAAATLTFLTVIARPMLEKLDRVKTKYGLVELHQVSQKSAYKHEVNN
ncbi:MAG: ATP-binding cassette domain-containing protein [Defluviitaleaceae bacterium]|nr:ATP-binding cassette domain-containing protein [Defluviitaleaceae bacterium]